ncbi:GntR family transcriptional regulator [Pseudoroseicyclus tamaricis]|uniref:GntR family transcriptional regulator n=1 Tax=Pseudoroseicyclus tamaricis TaxID=2705421 RepID=A0A6B2JFY8_9RHOB|nr:GntR family transcriptional regulator [Pseudoroseicyclus tamaricis]NDV00031.1 GntR family transcriptional regulator [Pseudoroseicyclus tamaricis]
MAKDTARPDWAQITESLSQDIILGRRHPRERLIEDDVIAETGATRHAVRRAFDELEKQGLAERQPNRGIRVRDYPAEEVEALYEIRDALERRAALRFTAPAPEALLAELTRIADAHEAACEADDMQLIFEQNNRFHAAIYGACGNPQLAEAIHHYTVTTQPIRTRAFPFARERQRAIAEHREMIEALRRSDGPELAEIISRHIAGPKNVFLSAYAV